MMNPVHPLPITRQCQLLSLNRSKFYYQPKAVSEEGLKLMRRIDDGIVCESSAGRRKLELTWISVYISLHQVDEMLGDYKSCHHGAVYLVFNFLSGRSQFSKLQVTET